jgi:2Fe-2S ferredoxin
MPRLTVTDHQGRSTTIEAAIGQSVMRAVIDSGIDGLVAECGGTLSCATCHAYVSPGWLDRVPAAEDDEKIMIECAIDPRENSRLTCRIVVNEELDGLELEIPASQY